MAARSTTAARLNLEDFRRLGVRPHEYRLTVIRRAAIRSARTLAEQQLSKPSPKAGLQLSRVATSTYRLLDPRLRRDMNHRAYVGRILPQSLSGAGQTGFCSELSDFRSITGEIGKVPFERSALSDAELIEMLDLDSPSRVKLAAKEDWVTSLSDVDLLQSTRVSRRIARWNARRRLPWFSMAAAGLAFGGLVGFAVQQRLSTDNVRADIGLVAIDVADLNPGGPSLGRVPLDSTALGDQRSAPVQQSLLSTTLDRQARSVTAAPQVKRSLIPDDKRELFADERAERISSNDPNLVVESPEPLSSVPASSVPLLANSALTRAAELDIASTHDELPPQNDQGLSPLLESGRSLILPDPFGPQSDAAEPDALPPKLASTLPMPTPADPFPDPAAVTENPVIDNPVTETSRGLLVAVPSEASRRIARRELIGSIPELAISVEAEGAVSRIQQLELIEGRFKSGSVKQWVICAMIAETAWLVESGEQVERRLVPLVEGFEVSSNRLLADTFVGASEQASLPSTRTHLLYNGLRLADQLLLASEPELCKQVVTSVGPFASTVPGRGEQVSEYLGNYFEAVDLMTRYVDVVARANRQSDDLGLSDIRILGRHHCLLLRRWDTGLAWLSESTNWRIAQASKQELKLTENPTADELKDVADQWLAAATQVSGCLADSIRLHAVDLLRQAQPKAAGLTKLEIDRQLDLTITHVPPHLLPLPAVSFGSRQGSRSTRLVPFSGIPLF